METRSGPVQIVGVPWPSRSTLLTKEEHRALSIDEIDKKIEEILTDTIRDEAEALDPAIPAVLTAHIAMHGSKVKTGSEEWMTVGRFPALQPSMLDADRFDYVALGHHHIQQQVGSRPPTFYAGLDAASGLRRGARREGLHGRHADPALPAGQRVTEVEFHRVRARRFVTVDVTVRGEDATGEVIAAIRRADVRGAIVRVLITLTPQQNAALRDNDVREALAGAHYIATISKNLQQERRRRAFDEDAPERMAPIEAVRRYFESRETPPDYREQLLTHARAIIDGEEGAE